MSEGNCRLGLNEFWCVYVFGFSALIEETHSLLISVK